MLARLISPERFDKADRAGREQTELTPLPWQKRLLDVCLSLGLLVALSPLMFVIMVAIKLNGLIQPTHRGPSFLSDPRGEGLLFPSDRGGGMIWDLRKALDAIARSAGWEAGEIRTRMFRHTYCATRLQTLDRGAPVSPWVVSREMGHGGRSLVDRVYGHLGDVRRRSEMVEFRVEQHREQLAKRAQKAAHLSL